MAAEKEALIKELKNKRRGHVASLNAFINKINTLKTDEKNISKIKSLMFDFPTKLTNYQNAHSEFIHNIEDANEKDAVQDKHDKEMEKYVLHQDTVTNWIKSIQVPDEEDETEEIDESSKVEIAAKTEDVDVSSQRGGKEGEGDQSFTSSIKCDDKAMDILEKQMKMIQLLSQQQIQMSLPQQEITPYEVDPLEFVSFITSFENIIESRLTDDKVKLYYLEQYTKGEVRNLIKSYQSMNPSRAFKEAKKKLKQVYGNGKKVVASYLRKIQDWPDIRNNDGDALYKFSLFLMECQNNLESIGELTEVEHPTNMRSILEKLPFDLKKGWRKLAYRITEVKEEKLKFTHLVDYVFENAQELSHPLFGDILEDRRPRRVKSFPEKYVQERKIRSSNYATQTNLSQTTKKCELCKAPHTLHKCIKFKDLTVDERRKVVMMNNLCLACMLPNHRARDCKQAVICIKCKKPHDVLLHYDKTTANEWKKEDKKSVETKCFAERGGNDVYMGIVPIKIKTSSGEVLTTYAFLDNGSSHTFITEDLRKKLKENGRPCNLYISTLEKKNSLYSSYAVNGLEISDLKDRCTIQLPEVYTKASFPVSKADAISQEKLRKYKYLNKVYIPELKAEVGILIGNNVIKATEPIQFIKSQENGPYAIRTRLGWSVYGQGSSFNSKQMKVCSTKVDMQLEKQVEKWINMEMSPFNNEDPYSQEDQAFLNNFEKTIMHENGHYIINLPRKDEEKLPNNYSMAIARLNYLKKKLSKSERVMNEYKAFMSDMLNKGYAEEVPSHENKLNDGRIWYLPHHHVYHPAKPDKIRIVFDGSARYQNICLNEKLFQGPDAMNSLFGVLLRFRKERIAIMGDIESMFLQVQVPPEDRNMLRFLWWKNGNMNEAVVEYRMSVYLFGSICSPSTAMLTLKRTADDNSDKFGEDVINTIKRNFYVDDCLKSLKSEDEAIKMIADLKFCLSKGGFKIAKWVSNSKEVLMSILEEERAKEFQALDLASKDENLPAERALGIEWRLNTDTYGFKIKEREREMTRRGILSIVSSVYDPLGLAAPFVLPAKLLLQDLTRNKLSWDEPIPDPHVTRWRKWLEDLPRLKEFSLPRCILPEKFGKIKKVEIHHFADASSQAYGSVSYLRLIDKENNVHCTLLCSKGRVAPLNQVSIPRMELNAAALAVRINKQLIKELDFEVNQVYFWSDSTAVIKYITNEKKRFQTYVANRISMIKQGSNANQWNYIKSKENPADELSRGQSICHFLENKRWTDGPEFLKIINFKAEQVEDFDIDDNDPEVKRKILINATTIDAKIHPIEYLISKCSKWYKLKRIVAWIIRYKNNLKSKFKEKAHLRLTSKNKNAVSPLTTEETKEAQNCIFKYIQGKEYSEELSALLSSAQVKCKSTIAKLDPIMLNQMLCVGGRLKYAIIPDESKHQIIIPRGLVAELIIKYAHENNGHMGRESTLNKVREKFWIIKGNSFVRKILRECRICRRVYAKPSQQKMGDLPLNRIQADVAPFTHVGIDCFGPYYVKQQRKTSKRYGLIFTCLKIRAIHIEVLCSLDTDSFIQALRRFISRRGQVQEIVSDNGKNFVGAQKELKNCLKNWNSQVSDFLLQKEIKWRFNPPAASHQGGVWERCIRSIRRVFAVLLKNELLTDESLMTLFCEVEGILNSRPLTKVSDDSKDLEALTPNHLLLLKTKGILPYNMFTNDDSYCRRKWKHVQLLADNFWKRWTKEYLPLLQSRQKWIRPKDNLRKDDIVIVVDDLQSRNHWPLGRIMETYPDSEGAVRRIKVKTMHGEYIRPINKVCMLESNGLD